MFHNTEQIITKFTSHMDDKQADYLKHENSNYVYSLPLLRHNLHNHAEEEFLFSHVLPAEIKRLYDEGIVYVHDKQLAPYCVSISCVDIASKGIPSLAKNMISSQPTTRLSTLIRHFSNVVTLISQQVSGAVMLAQMIARHKIHVDEDGYYEGKYNFWSKARRHDWNVRNRLKEETLKGVVRQ